MKYSLIDWFSLMVAGIPLTVVLAWFRVRTEGWKVSFWWRLVISGSISIVFSPVFFFMGADQAVLVLPAVDSLGGLFGYDGYVAIVIDWVLLFGFWSFAVHAHKALKCNHTIRAVFRDRRMWVLWVLTTLAAALFFISIFRFIPEVTERLNSQTEVMSSDQAINSGDEKQTMRTHKYQMNGYFDAWTNYEIANVAKPFDPFDIRRSSTDKSVDNEVPLKFYCDNDQQFLYVFFPFKQPNGEHYKTNCDGFYFGDLYFDMDMDTNTGSISNRDHTGAESLQGADIKTEISGGCASSAVGPRWLIAYDVFHWNQKSQLFDREVATQKSYYRNPLIGCGRDGISLAIALSDLGAGEHSKFNIAFMPFGLDARNLIWTMIQLKPKGAIVR